MNEMKVIRTGYLVLCTLLAIILPHITSTEDIPTLTQIVLQLAFLTIGVVVYTKTEEK